MSSGPEGSSGSFGPLGYFVLILHFPFFNLEDTHCPLLTHLRSSSAFPMTTMELGVQPSDWQLQVGISAAREDPGAFDCR